jgi:hypothetical protein
MAKDWLKNDSCVKLVGATLRDENQNTGDLTYMLNDAKPHFANLPAPTATPDPSNPNKINVSYKIGADDSGIILLNNTIFPNPGKNIGNTPVSVLGAFNQDYGVSLDATQLLALTILCSAMSFAETFCALTLNLQKSDGEPRSRTWVHLIDPAGRVEKQELVQGPSLRICDFGFGAYFNSDCTQ